MSKIARARTDTFEHTISGLLTKRADLFNEADLIRDRLAEIRNDIAAVDRVLATLGYSGDLNAAMPRAKRNVVFGKGELTRAILDELREATAPMTSRELAQAVISLRGDDPRDRRYVADLTKRVGKACRALYGEGRVRKATDAQCNVVWSRSVGMSANRSPTAAMPSRKTNA